MGGAFHLKDHSTEYIFSNLCYWCGWKLWSISQPHIVSRNLNLETQHEENNNTTHRYHKKYCLLLSGTQLALLEHFMVTMSM